MTDITLPDLEKTRSCYCLAARKRARELTRRYEAALRPYGLKATQFSVLAALSQTGPLPVTQLAEILGLERTTLTRVAGVMEKHGLLSISAGSKDERVRVLAVTAKGRNRLTKAIPAWKRVQDAVARELK